MDMVKIRRGGLDADGSTTPGKIIMNKYEMRADMTEHRQYWEMMLTTGPQRWEDVSKG